MKNLEDYVSLNYPISVYQDEEGDYIAKVDDLPGCIADGATPGEAFDNARIATRSWIESRLKAGLEVPQPRLEQEFSGRILLRMPRWLHKRLSQQARTDSVSLNQYIVSLLADRGTVAQQVVHLTDWNSPTCNLAMLRGQQDIHTVMANVFDVGGVSSLFQSQSPLIEAHNLVTGLASPKERKTLGESTRGQLVA